MPFEKVCAYAHCQKPFSARYRKALYCSQSCGSKARVIEATEDVKAYLLANIRMPIMPSGCWIWEGGLTDNGYGLACVRNTRIRAHRLVYEIFVGLIPQHMDLLHGTTCHTRSCVNPAHVRIGTNLDNIRDRQAWGNEQRGSVHYATNLSETEVLHILQEFHEKGLSISAIAKKRNDNVMTIHDIIQRKTWTHVVPGQYPAPGDQRARVTKDIVREMRHLREQEQWNYTSIADHINRTHPGIGLSYNTTIDICTYRSWKTLPATPEIPLPQEAQEPLTEDGIRLMLGEYAAACAKATFQGRTLKITPFAERYARKFGITNMAARMILKRQTWKWLAWDCLNIGPYCDCCGDCLVCDGTMPCHMSETRKHFLRP